MASKPHPKRPKTTYAVNMPHMRPLFGHEEGAEGGRRAAEKYAELRDRMGRTLKKDFPERPEEFFAELAETYWHERHWFEREKPPEFAENLSKFSTATAAYLATVQSTPSSVIVEIERQLRKQESQEASTRFGPQLATLLQNIAGAAARLKPPKGSGGAYPKRFADAPVAKLDALWSSVVGKPVPKASIEGRASFASHGGQFVLEIMRAIDQRITAEEVNTAINKLPRRPKI